MSVKLKIIIFSVTLNLFQHLQFSAQKQIDSLLAILIKCKEDTNKVKIINDLAWEISNHNLDSAIILSNQSLLLCKKLDWKKGEAITERLIGGHYNSLNNYTSALTHLNKSLEICDFLISDNNKTYAAIAKKIKSKTYNNIANVFLAQTNYPKAIENYLKGLNIAESFGDKATIGLIYGNIANVYAEEADFPKSMDYYMKGLKIAEELGDKWLIAANINNIGIIYNCQENHPKAIEYFLKSLKLSEELNDKASIGNILVNIGNEYIVSDNYEKALEYFFKGLKIIEEMGDILTAGRTLANIGIVYADQGEYTKALDYYFKGLKKSEESNDVFQIGIVLGNIGKVKTNLGQYKEAESYLIRGLKTTSEIGLLDAQKEIEYSLHLLYKESKRYDLTFKHYEKYIQLKDSIYNVENSKKLIRTELNREYEKQEAVAKTEHKAELEKQQEVAEEKSRKQKIIIFSAAIGLLLVVIFAGYVFKTLNQTRKQKLLIEHKTKEIEEKQKEILDSIHYAKRIQTALIPSDKYIDKSLNKLQKRK